MASSSLLSSFRATACQAVYHCVPFASAVFVAVVLGIFFQTLPEEAVKALQGQVTACHCLCFGLSVPWSLPYR